jgi:serine/threonine-protein kinase
VQPAQFSSVLLSPDGRSIVFSGMEPAGGVSLYVRRFGSLEVRAIPGTERTGSFAFWAPDNRTVVFEGSGSLKAVDLDSGTVRTLCSLNGGLRGGTMNRSGQIVFAQSASQDLLTIHREGGAPLPLGVSTKDTAAGSLRFPVFLPDGTRFLYKTFPGNEILLASLDHPGPGKRVQSAESQALLAGGYLLFARQDTLFAQLFDDRTGTVSGREIPIAQQLIPDPNGRVAASVSETGSLAYATGGGPTTRLTVVDRQGRTIRTIYQPGRYRNPLLSPDGSRIAVELAQERSRDIWLIDVAREIPERLTLDSDDGVFPVWSPNGDRIAFGSDRENGVFSLYVKPSRSNAGDEVLFKSTTENVVPYDWTRDGRFIVHRTMNKGFFTTGVLSLDEDAKTRVFRDVTFNLSNSVVSPNGRWLAYNSGEAQGTQVYIENFPAPGTTHIRVSRDGGVHPKWSDDGAWLYYYGADGMLMAVPVTERANGQDLTVGAAVPLFPMNILNGPVTQVGFRAQYDVWKGGRQFLLNVPVEIEAPSITVVLDWEADMRR